VTNNNDREKILATVGVTLHYFFSKKPHTMVYAKGNTRARTRLYQMGISMLLEEYIPNFDIYGELEGDFERFRKDKNYDAFLVLLKNI